jgi:predicted nucleotidyltransferase
MSILKPIVYFSLFNHPLTKDEIFLFSDETNKHNLTSELDKLKDTGILKEVDNYFLIDNNLKNIKKRIHGNFEAKKVMPKVKKVAAFVSKFPFIKGVAISGSLSKGYFDHESDFDFFVITKEKRVWVSRVFFAAYKRLFLKNSYKEFCVNYFVSTTTLEIEEKNRFTATEIATVIPLFGEQEFKNFYKANDWVTGFFPNLDLKNRKLNIKPVEKNKSIKCIEFLLDNYLGTLINYLIMKMISKNWEKRYVKKSNNPYKAKKEISKHHPDNFQQQVLTKINEKYSVLEKKYGININKEIA